MIIHTDEDLLTQEEQAIIEQMADVFNRFAALPMHHPSDVSEFAQGVHVLQRQVMCRAARRAYPHLFPHMATVTIGEVPAREWWGGPA